MAAEMKVTEAAVEAALQAVPFADEGDDAMVWQQIGYSNARAEKIMRAALEAGLAAMLEPVGYLHVGLRQTDLLTARDFDGSEEKLTKWASLANAPTAYRIKP